MSYPVYLRDRASDCIRLAVEGAGRKGADALIDLAQDYSTWASMEERRAAEPGGQRQDEIELERDEPSGTWWRWLGRLH